MVDDESVGDLHVGTVVVDVQDMGRAVAFYTAALGYRTRDSERDLEFCVVGHVDLE